MSVPVLSVCLFDFCFRVWLLLFFVCVGMASGARGSAWSPGRRRRGGGWCEDSATSDEDLLSDAGIDVEDDEVSNGRRPV